jgi:aldose 1-epimerase
LIPGGERAELFTLTNARGIEVRFTTYGGIIVSVRVPGRTGELDDVTLGFDSLEGYLGDHPYFGALIGRYANRIAGGRVELNGRAYTLATNEGPNHLHGGRRGFDKIIWDAQPFQDDTGVGARLTHTSPAGDEGYPGTLTTRVTYTLTDRDELAFDYHATTDEPTPINLTQHSYFNLAGAGASDIVGHELMLSASHFTPIDAALIPTGELRNVAGTPFDFRTPAVIGSRIDQEDEQLCRAGGFDHNFVLDRRQGEPISLAARLYHPPSGRVLEVHTTEPGVQLYTGNALDGSVVGKEGRRYGRRGGLSLETQHFPDSPNQPDFPCTILRPGEQYTSRTIYKFSVDER